MGFQRIANLADLPPGAMCPATPGGKPILLCNHEGRIHALDGLCPHRNGPLHQGNFVDGLLICPWHAWEFRCSDGCYDYNPDIALAKYPVEIRGTEIWVDV